MSAEAVVRKVIELADARDWDELSDFPVNATDADEAKTRLAELGFEVESHARYAADDVARKQIHHFMFQIRRGTYHERGQNTDNSSGSVR